MSGRILIVDDVATNRVILAAKLTAAYFDVVFAETGAEALDKCRTERPDLVLLDVLMPGFDGFETCRRIKGDPALAEIPVIMISTLLSAENRVAALKVGADDFYSRPENEGVLIARVRNLLRAKRVMDDLSLRGQALDDLGLVSALQTEGPALKTKPSLNVIEIATASLKPLIRATKLAKRYTLTYNDSAAKSPPDLVLIAADPSGPRHFRRIATLRADLATRAVPILLILPQSDPKAIAEALDLGANDVLVTPDQDRELTLRIDHWLDRKIREDRLRNRLQNSLSEAALDPLTGLHNRRYFERHFARTVAESEHSGKGFALLMIDIDKFKRVNDKHGHQAGDDILCELAERLNSNLRSVDLVARIGGEEFLVAMPGTTRAEAMAAAERLRNLIATQPFLSKPGSPGITLTASIGLVCDRDVAGPLARLTDAADQAMYRSKHKGRNMVTVFSFAA